ncbi:MAG: P1 family peptidase [Elainellaceae cyanobacterium]
MGRTRLRDLGITMGRFLPGQNNAITDVSGVLVGHSTIIKDEPRVARTGVTAIVPRYGDIWTNHAFAGSYCFNGNGEMTGLLWLEESGLLTSAIALTNTHSVGVVRDALNAYCLEQGNANSTFLPVAAETYDGWLNDIHAFHVTPDHVKDALAIAQSGPCEEGNVGGGTGTICHEFKGGIGTASRLVPTSVGQYVLGVLVQTNYGRRHSLRIAGVPIGYELNATHTPLPWKTPPLGGSIIVIIATDAPLIPVQCKRLARRATVGLARTGGIGQNSSGDIFLAFSTGNDVFAHPSKLTSIKMLPHEQMDALFEALSEAVEEAILNALVAAKTMTGFQGHTAYALPLDVLKHVMKKYRPFHGFNSDE